MAGADRHDDSEGGGALQRALPATQSSPATYASRIDGLVDRPKAFTPPQLRTMPQTRVIHDMVCTDGRRVENTPPLN
ncbi:molybdopterin-dependent oxidoreductase [Streptomyces sp. AcE210]|uniref:molybdopterin-dependent oxidoreductase n=1 Tax=Streptomyces sp. AcE210 TaxID=2292703 RepID=UPI000E3068F6|nr:molybdopterin-dependent oxidoreductase [Streptomyces sp. AcE210]RFC77835.1 hypothetical protein DXZ75_08325 [Streptomyces sp. AcE210]